MIYGAIRVTMIAATYGVLIFLFSMILWFTASIIIEKNQFGITYFMIHSPKDPEYLHRRFTEPESQINRHYKLYRLKDENATNR